MLSALSRPIGTCKKPEPWAVGKERKSLKVFIYSITQMVLGILEVVTIVGEIDMDIAAAAVSLLIPDQPLICVGSCLGCILFELTIE